MLYTLKKTLQQLRAQDNHYLVCVKANPARLDQSIELQWQHGQPVSHYQQQQHSHGRSVKRVVQVFEPLGEFAQAWIDLRSLISVERYRLRQAKPFDQRHY